MGRRVEAQEGETGRPAGGRAPATCTAASGGDLAGTAFQGALGSGKRRGARGGDRELVPEVGGVRRGPGRRHYAAARDREQWSAAAARSRGRRSGEGGAHRGR